MLRAQTVAICLALPLAACSSQDGSDWSSVYAMAKQYWNGDPGISLQQAAAVPYASIGVRIGDGPQAFLVLATATGDDTMWVAGKSVAIETRGGRVVRTSGLAHDLSNYWRATTLHAGDSEPWTEPATMNWLADFGDRNGYAASITCQRGTPVSDPVTLLGKTIATLRVDERCEAPAIGWRFTNNFWVDADSGFVWRSIQHIRPDLDPLEIEVLRPPSG